MSSEIKTPPQFIKSITNQSVLVHMADESIIEGKFICIDGNLNVVLEQAIDTHTNQ